MLKALIVEDEYLAQEELIYLIKTYSDIDIVGVFDDGVEAFKFLQTNQVDVVFLDINIPSIDGMLLARNIHQFSQKPHIVFTTAYKEFAVDAFELEAFDYLLKPLNEDRMKKLLRKLETLSVSTEPAKEINDQPNTINVQHDNRIRVMPVVDICYAEADEKNTRIFTHDGEFSVPYTISELVEKLPEEHFFRTHRSFCVNLNCIEEITPWVNSTYLLKLHHLDKQVPVSRSNLKTFREKMHL